MRLLIEDGVVVISNEKSARLRLFGNSISRKAGAFSVPIWRNFLQAACDRHRGSSHLPTPATPLCIRSVNGGSRSYASSSRTVKEGRVIGSTHWKAQQKELWRGPDTRGHTSSRIGCQLWRHPELQQCSPPTARGLPLPPEGTSKSEPHPTSEIDQHLGSFAVTCHSASNPATPRHTPT